MSIRRRIIVEVLRSVLGAKCCWEHRKDTALRHFVCWSDLLSVEGCPARGSLVFVSHVLLAIYERSRHLHIENVSVDASHTLNEKCLLFSDLRSYDTIFITSAGLVGGASF